jgi:hypothetical protein
MTCPDCENFYPAETATGCYCGFLKMRIQFDDKINVWFYEMLKHTELANTSVPIVYPSGQIIRRPARIYSMKRIDIRNCKGWGQKHLEADSSIY